MLLESVVTLASLFAPPVFDFIKKKFLKPEQDTAEATLSSLATTKPEILPQYLLAVVEKIKVDISWFNRDVIGAPRQWVIDLRAGIRPVAVALSIVALIANLYLPGAALAQGTRIFLESIISNWFGSKLVTKD
jgi:hypothetical protein